LKQACAPANVVLGIDIASYQHPNGAAINWATVAKSRRFVIVKASESDNYTNSYYADDVAKARAAGMIAGAYHYLTYDATGAAQAKHFITSIGGDVPDGDLPPMLDVEDVYKTDLANTTIAQRVAIMKDWLDTVETSTGRKPMIYSGAWYWASSAYMGTPTGFSDHPLVWSDYSGNCPSIPNDFPSLTIWQYLGGTGSTAGITGGCDQDKFYGTEADLQAFVNGGPDYRGESLGVSGQSYPIVSAGAVDIPLGTTATGWVKLKNTGKQTWKKNVVKLAPIPRDQPSPYQAPSWLTAARISTVTADVAPGAVGQFELDITGTQVGEAILNLGWVAEGITWFADSPKGGGPPDGYFAVKVNVTAAPGRDAGHPVDASTAGPDASTPEPDASLPLADAAAHPDGSAASADGSAEAVDGSTPARDGSVAPSVDAGDASVAAIADAGGTPVDTGCGCGSTAGAPALFGLVALLGLCPAIRRRAPCRSRP
jgi:GH25 family lysozyme M1 (1,4-beta-N-acetylmuramidase)